MAKPNEKTNKFQFETLVQYMENDENFANGKLNSVNTIREKWDNLTMILNEQGPPMKNRASWQRVWHDYKYHIKKKLRNEDRTNTLHPGKINFQYNDLERRVIELIKLKDNPITVRKPQTINMKFEMNQLNQTMKNSSNTNQITKQPIAGQVHQFHLNPMTNSAVQNFKKPFGSSAASSSSTGGSKQISSTQQHGDTTLFTKHSHNDNQIHNNSKNNSTLQKNSSSSFRNINNNNPETPESSFNGLRTIKIENDSLVDEEDECEYDDDQIEQTNNDETDVNQYSEENSTFSNSNFNGPIMQHNGTPLPIPSLSLNEIDDDDEVKITPKRKRNNDSSSSTASSFWVDHFNFMKDYYNRKMFLMERNYELEERKLAIEERKLQLEERKMNLLEHHRGGSRVGNLPGYNNNQYM